MATEFTRDNNPGAPQPTHPSPNNNIQAEESETLLPGTFDLVSDLQRRLSTGESFNNPQLTEIASRHFGGGRMRGAYTPKDAYDALEVAVNRLLLEGDARALMGMADPSLGLVHVLRPLLQQLPRQDDRTLEQQLLQQFSTPPTLAFVAARALNPNSSDILLEPSAGTASLAIWGAAVGAKVITNEISPRRRALLELLGFSTLALDAEYLDDLLPPEIKPTAVLMNPPFSATGGRVANNNTFYGARHFETMLKRLETGGRLSGISGQGMGLDKPTFSRWWRAIAAKYTVRANLSLPGDEYARYGTTFDNQLIVIDKTGPTPGRNWDEQLRHIRYGEMETLEQALEILASVALDRPAVGEVRTQPSAILIFNPQPQAAPTLDEPAEEDTPAPIHSTAPVREEQPSPVAATPQSATVAAPAEDESDDSVKPLDDDSTEEEREDDEAVVFVPYRPAMLRGGVEHPAEIVEAASMGAITPPPIIYRPHLPQRIISEGLLSNIQLERVIYAGQAHEQRLPNGARGGFFVGDGTGVGKGRILAGIIADNWFQGRRRALWLSVNNDLMDSTLRDLTDLGMRVPLARINDYLATADITLPAGVIFSSYSSLISAAKSGERRLDQIQKWLGADGVIILDECVPANTMIATPDGERPIQELKVGDIVVGFNHETARIEPTEVRHIFRRETNEPLHTINNTRMTGNHPVWTHERDYVRADEITSFDKLALLERESTNGREKLHLRVVPAILHPEIPAAQEGPAAPVLQYFMFSEMADESARICQIPNHGKGTPSLSGVPAENTQPPGSTAEVGSLSAFHLKHFLLARNAGKNAAGAQGAELRASYGRQREGLDRAAATFATAPGMAAAGVRCRSQAAAEGSPVTLQAGLSRTGLETSDRSRRPVTSSEGSQRSRRAEGSLSEVTRLDHTQISEREDTARLRERSLTNPQHRTVYNIETGTGNYFANDLLVHNCHKAKNALASGRSEPTQTGQAVIDLQDAERNPDYRIVYSSATGATDVRNMAYQTRLGLWGDGTSFSGGFSEFMVEIDSGGVGAMEMVARDLKALGKYASGSISFNGVEYREVVHYLSPEQRRMYDNMAQAWAVILQNIHEALAITNGDSRAKANAMTKFWGDHQRCCRQVISAFKVPTIIKEIERALSEDHAVVISLIGTGEARTKEQISKQVAAGGMLEDLDFGPRESICGMVDRGFPVNLYQEKTDPATGQTIRVPVLDGEGKPVQSKEALAMKQRLLDSLSTIELPEHPLDQIINYFGEDKVAELTGRKRRLIRRNGKLEYVKRAPEGVAMEKTNLHEMALFQKGKKPVAIISDAASTGISLHADLRSENHQRREHMTLELNWSADRQMQTFGRTHRSNQAVPPIYVLLSTELGGEKRFSSTIARRLGSLGALTKGDRGAADGGGDLAKYNFETDQGTAALKLLYTRILENNRVPGIESPRQTLRDMGLLVRRQDGTEEVKKEDLHNIPRFLNRVLALDVARQNAMFDYFADLFEQTVRYAKANGTFDEGVTDIRATAIRLGRSPKVVHEDKITGAKTTHYTLEVDQPTRPVSFNDAKNTLRSVFYQQKRSGHYIMAMESGSHTDPESGASYKTYALTKPEASRAYYVKESELVSKYQPVAPGEAQWWWDTRFSQVPSIVTVETHIIGGAIIPLWQHLKTEEGAILKVVRVTTVEGMRIVGIQIPKTKVARVLRALGISRSFKDPNKIFTGVLEEGEDINLVGGLKLRKSFVHKEEAIEVTGADPYRFGELRDLGLINEQIAYKQRFFIPTEPEKGIEVLTKLLQRYPAINAEGDESSESAETLETILDAHVTAGGYEAESQIIDVEAHIIEPEIDDSYQQFAAALPVASSLPVVGATSVMTLDFESSNVEAEQAESNELITEEGRDNADVIEVPTLPQLAAEAITDTAASKKRRKKQRNTDGAQLAFLWGTTEPSETQAGNSL